MRAAYIYEVGAPDKIIVGELPLPSIAEHQLLVKVNYTTVNHVDCYIRSGKYPQALPKPFIIGRDFCGEVVQVGAAIKRFRPGDKVWSHLQGLHGRQGTFAEYLAVNEESVFALPPEADPLSAVAVFHSAFTALLGLKREAKLQKGESIFIHGAAGNIGAMVIQVAKFLGANVIASTHSQEKIDYCYSLGADLVIDYKTDYALAIQKQYPDGVNVIWNTSRQHDFNTLLPLLSFKGRYILMAGSGYAATFAVGDLYTQDRAICGFAITNATQDEIERSAIDINDLLTHQAIQAKTYTVLPLERAQDAHRIIEQEEIWGKIIIDLKN